MLYKFRRSFERSVSDGLCFFIWFPWESVPMERPQNHQVAREPGYQMKRILELMWIWSYHENCKFHCRTLKKQIGAKTKHWTEEPEDEDSLFCRSLVPWLKRLPSQSKAFIRLQIEQLLYQTRFTGPRTQPNFRDGGCGHSDFPWSISWRKSSNF